MPSITINGKSCEAATGATILSVASANGIYIPTICHHPDLPAFAELPMAKRVFRGNTAFDHCAATQDELRKIEGCGLCVVEVEGQSEPLRACATTASPGMAIQTESDALSSLRRVSLAKTLAHHPHACLTCAQQEGCSLEDCSSNVPKEERCCSQFHTCELRKVAEYVGVKEDTPRYRPTGPPAIADEPLITREFALCIDCTRCVRVCSQVRGVEALGVVHTDGKLVVGSLSQTLLESACKFCGACVEVCPTGCLTDKDAKLGDRENWLVPCVHTCPANVDVPAYIRRIAAGDFKGAAAVVWERLPLANTLGHICFHLCECECRRELVDDAIAICALKRFALEMGDGEFLKETVELPESDKRVAVVGSGPAGLAAAYFLRFKGYNVTVFEAAKAAGGMPALSIPSYRLPQDVLAKDLDVIRNLGVEIKTGCDLATDESMTDLLNQGYDALLLAVGLPESKKIPLEGSHLEGVLWGLDFLRDVKSGEIPQIGKNVVVIGGGNVAIDVAMTALRLSSGKVSLFCLESREEMPAYEHEIHKAESEGIEINASWGPVAVLGTDSRVSGVELRRCAAVFDDQGRFFPTFDEEKRTTAEADCVILAIGQSPPKSVPVERDGVFLAGDITAGHRGGSAVEAVASGRAAAGRIDKHLGGDGQVSVRLVDESTPDPRIGREEGFAPRPRIAFPCAPPTERCADFREIEGTYECEAAIAEAKRCLQCDLRLMLAQPVLPPEKWLVFSHETVEAVPPLEGVFILADADKKAVIIKGTANIREALDEKLASDLGASFFLWEEDRMYSKRESELIQRHVEQYGELPGGGDDELDDLF